MRAGQQLRLAGQGSPGFGGGPAGDLYLEVQFEPHPRYRVDNRDLYLTLPVAPWEAALGAVVRAPTPDGMVDLNVPAGSQTGRKLRLRQRGIPGDPPGDLYVVNANGSRLVDLTAGKKSLSPGEPRLVDYEIYKDGFIIARGQYIVTPDTPLFINGPDFHHGRLIFVIESR